MAFLLVPFMSSRLAPWLWVHDLRDSPHAEAEMQVRATGFPTLRKPRKVPNDFPDAARSEALLAADLSGGFDLSDGASTGLTLVELRIARTKEKQKNLAAYGGIHVSTALEYCSNSSRQI